jgi:competence protein ComEC
MAAFAAAFCAGALALHLLPAAWPPAAIAAIAVLAAIAARFSHAAAGALAGFALAQAVASHALATSWPCSRDREAVELEGRIADPPLERDGRTDFDLELAQAPPTGPAMRRVRLAWYEPEGRPAPGETWRFDVTLRCRRGFANPGALDRELALLMDGVDATGYVSSGGRALRLARAGRLPVERLRMRIADAVAAAVPAGPTTAVLQGLSVGVRGNIPDALWEAFAVTGVAHLMAISGLHVTGCAVAVLALLRLAGQLRSVARLRARVALESLAVVGMTAAYTALSGASVPALRTLATVALIALLRVMRRSMEPASALALAAFLLAAGSPIALGSAGFWLSFVATAALLTVVAGGHGWQAPLARFARAQAAVTVLLAPVLAATFGRLSLVSPLANAVAIPAFGIALLPAVLAGTVIAAISPDASAFVWRALSVPLDGAWPLLETMAAWPLASWAPAAQPVAATAGALGLATAAWLLPVTGLRMAAAVVLAALLAGGPARIDRGAFTMTVVDVGQGLAVVVETASHVLVFDAGPRWRGGGTAARVSILPLLRARGRRAIDALVVSHDDLDHAGGADVVARAFAPKRRLGPDGSREGRDAACLRGDRWDWDGVRFRVLHPPPAFEGSDNDRSCAIGIAGPGGTALLLADPEAAAESLLAAAAIRADVVLLPHHGSRTSSSPELVAAARARLGIASAGFGNRWGMPVAGVVARWRSAGTTVLDTAKEGAITVRFPSRPGPFAVTTERRSHPRWWRAAADP